VISSGVGLLDEPGLDELVAGCPTCGGSRVRMRSYCDARRKVMLADPVGAYAWAYDGEKFVDGVFVAECNGCGATLFAADCCPRCHAPGAVDTILAADSRLPVPKKCRACGEMELLVTALVPVDVVSEGKRLLSRECEIEPGEPGFHALRIECPACGAVDEPAACPLCGAPGPLRPRP
jgi:hypothetical protein